MQCHCDSFMLLNEYLTASNIMHSMNLCLREFTVHMKGVRKAGNVTGCAIGISSEGKQNPIERDDRDFIQ